MKPHLYVTRRLILRGSAVLGSAVVLAACADSDPAPGSTAGGATASPDRSEPCSLTGGIDAVEWTIEVGPAVVTEGVTLVHMRLFPTEGEEVLGTSVFSSFLVPGDFIGAIRLLDLPGAGYYRESGGSSDGVFSAVSADKPLELNPLFPAVPEGTKEVTVFLPSFGVFSRVPVVSSTDVFDVDAALAASSPDLGDGGPYPLQSLIGAADGSAETHEGEDTTTVVVSGDVTFASDSAELSEQADTVLASVTEQVTRYPSGGSLAITGHTDDVDSDAHNQDLSQRRAQAVADRLAQLASLSAWSVSVVGKGESEPRVANDSDENRAANRRVEVVLTPTDASEGEEKPAPAAAGELPDPGGPVGTGKDGVDVSYKDATLHVSMDQVVRADGCLMGRVLVSTDQSVSFSLDAFHMPRQWQTHWGPVETHVCSLTLLKGGTRYMPLQALIDTTLWPVTDRGLSGFDGPGAPTPLPVVWPDTGEDTVTLDLPGNGDGAIALRLTGIPVVEA